MKRCSRCHVEKPETDFYKRRGTDLQHQCKTCSAEYSRERRNHPEGREVYLATKRRIRLRRYSLTAEQYDALLAEQDGGCAICGEQVKDERSYRLHVDHDHSCCPGKESCGKCVRGLLCDTCNRGLGQFGDNVELLRKAIAYIEARSTVQTMP